MELLLSNAVNNHVILISEMFLSGKIVKALFAALLAEIQLHLLMFLKREKMVDRHGNHHSI